MVCQVDRISISGWLNAEHRLYAALSYTVPGSDVSHFAPTHVFTLQPRKGCFEVREADGTTVYVSLTDMPRPFTKLKVGLAAHSASPRVCLVRLTLCKASTC
jgi:hypothetical protein